MSAIIKNFKVRMTKEQARQVRKEWLSAKTNLGSMLAVQPVDTAGPFTLSKPFFNFAVLSPELTQAVSAILASHRPDKAEPK